MEIDLIWMKEYFLQREMLQQFILSLLFSAAITRMIRNTFHSTIFVETFCLGVYPERTSFQQWQNRKKFCGLLLLDLSYVECTGKLGVYILRVVEGAIKSWHNSSKRKIFSCLRINVSRNVYRQSSEAIISSIEQSLVE